MAIEKTKGRAARLPAGDMTSVFDHIAVWTEDTEKTAKFLDGVLGWKRHPIIISVSNEEKTTGGMLGTFFDAPGLWIELIEPTCAGPGQEILDQMGDGALVEINFDMGLAYEKGIERAAKQGVEMVSMDGSPLVDGGRIEEGVMKDGVVEEPGQRIAYFPTSLTGGTTIEYYEVNPENSANLLVQRDLMWSDESRAPGTPFIDHVGILVQDVEQVATFYKNYMDKTVQTEVFEEDGARIKFIDGQGADDTPLWIKLVQPTAPGHAQDLMNKFGKGYIFELGVQVDDLDAFTRKMGAKSINMVQFDGAPFANGENAVKLSTGDRTNYFPLDTSCGIRIMMFERGPKATSLMHRRDQLLAH